MTFCVTNVFHLTNVDTDFSVRSRRSNRLPRSHQLLAQAIDQLPLALRKVVLETVDRLDDHAPLGQAGHCAEGVQPSLELEWHPDAELRIVLDPLSMLRAGGRTTHPRAFFRFGVVT